MRSTSKRWRWTLISGAMVIALMLIVAAAFAVEFQAKLDTSNTFGDPPAQKGLFKVGETVNYFVEVKNTSASAEAYNLSVCFEDPDGVTHSIESDFALAAGWRKVYYPDRVVVYNAANVEQSDTPTDLSFLAYEVTASTPVLEEAGVNRFYADICVTGKQQGPAGEETIDYKLALPRRLISPSTDVGISVDKETVYAGEEVEWTVKEWNNGDVPLTNPHVVLNDEEQDTNDPAEYIYKLVAPPDSGDTNDDGILDPGETWEWKVLMTVDADVEVWAFGHGLDPVGDDIDYLFDPDEKDSVSVDVINPATTVSISADPETIYSGDEVTWTVSEKNTGDVALTDPYVNLNTAEDDSAGLAKLEKASPAYDGGDANDDGVLDPDETWVWKVKTNPTADVEVWAFGHGIDPLQTDIDYQFDPNEKDSASVKVINPSTKMTSTALDPGVFYAGDDVTVQFHEKNDGDVALTDVYADIELDGEWVAKKAMVGDLAPNITWGFDYTVENVQKSGTVCAIGHGLDPLKKDITYPDYPEKACVEFMVIDPKIEIIKYVSVDDGANWHDANTEGEAPEAPEAGAPIKWKIVVSNPNDFEMKITSLTDDFADQAMLAGYVDTVLAPKGEPGDSFEVIYDDVAPAAGTSKMNLAKVCAVDTMIGTKEVCDEDPAWVKSPEEGGPTRTVGFWGQHFDYTKHVFDEHCGGSIDLGWVTLENIDQVMAVLNFDAIVKNKGLTPDENKMLNTSRQLVAAILNECAFGTQAPMIEGVSIIDIAREKLVSGSIDEIVWIGCELDKFNNSGCDYELYGWDSHYDPTVKYWGTAKPQAARASGAAAIEWLLMELRS